MKIGRLQTCSDNQESQQEGVFYPESLRKQTQTIYNNWNLYDEGRLPQPHVTYYRSSFRDLNTLVSDKQSTVDLS